MTFPLSGACRFALPCCEHELGGHGLREPDRRVGEAPPGKRLGALMIRAMQTASAYELRAEDELATYRGEGRFFCDVGRTLVQ
jgi:hypothetical protein